MLKKKIQRDLWAVLASKEVMKFIRFTCPIICTPREVIEWVQISSPSGNKCVVKSQIICICTLSIWKYIPPGTFETKGEISPVKG